MFVFVFLTLDWSYNVPCLLNAMILYCRRTITKYVYIPPPAHYFKCVPMCGDDVNEGGMEKKCSSKCTVVITLLTIYSAVLLIKLTILPLFVFVFSPLQMFIADKVEDSNCSLHEFSITGSTYAPEGQMWVSHFKDILLLLGIISRPFCELFKLNQRICLFPLVMALIKLWVKTKVQYK